MGSSSFELDYICSFLQVDSSALWKSQLPITILLWWYLSRRLSLNNRFYCSLMPSVYSLYVLGFSGGCDMKTKKSISSKMFFMIKWTYGDFYFRVTSVWHKKSFSKVVKSMVNLSKTYFYSFNIYLFKVAIENTRKSVKHIEGWQ